MRLVLSFLLSLFAAEAAGQTADLAILAGYGRACLQLQTDILSDEPSRHSEGRIVEWISKCNGNIPACWETRKLIRERKRASPLDCLGREQSHEAASAAYSLYLEITSPLPKCIARRC